MIETNEADDITFIEEQPEPDTVTGDIYELMRIRRVKGCIERLAYLFERYGLDHCQGDCERPVSIAPMFPEAITCCNLQPVYLYHRQILGLEAALLRKIQSHKPRLKR